MNPVLQATENAFLAELLRQAAIHADETVVQVNKEPGREATEKSRIWAYASSKLAESQIRYFRYPQAFARVPNGILVISENGRTEIIR